jgi:hypothetical protein
MKDMRINNSPLLAGSIFLVCAALAYPMQALAFDDSVYVEFHENEPLNVPPAPPPPPPPPPPTPPTSSFPTFPTTTLPQLPFRPPVVVPTDVTFNSINFGSSPYRENAVKGIQMLADNKFPKKEDLTGSGSGILVVGLDGSNFSRPNTFEVKLVSGELLISVKKPSQGAIVETPLGTLSVKASGDAVIRYVDGILRVFNLDGYRAMNVMVKLDKDNFGSEKRVTCTIKPGFELVASTSKLGYKELHPSDGIARRGFQSLHQGCLAISEYSVESMLKNNEIIIGMTQSESGSRERKALGDMSKMAAVLNHVNGNYGYVENKPMLAGSNQQVK